MPNRGKLVAQRDNTGTPSLTSEPLAQRGNHCLGQRLAGARRKRSREPVGFRVLDTQRYVSILY